MSYPKSNKAVSKVERYLEGMLSADSDISWICADPVKLAYQVREALTVAQERPQLHAKYAELKRKFAIKVLPGKITAALKVQPAVAITPTIAQFVKTVDRLQIPQVATLLEVLGAAVKHANMPELYFPDAQLDASSLRRLYNWTSTHEFHIIVGQGITLTKQPTELAYKPPMLEREATG